jgi:hypothetical protein
MYRYAIQGMGGFATYLHHDVHIAMVKLKKGGFYIIVSLSYRYGYTRMISVLKIQETLIKR